MNFAEWFAGSGSVIRHDGGVITAQHIVDEGRRLASALTDQGFEPGDRIAVQLPNGIDYVRLLIACGTAGFVAVSVNTRYSEREAADLVERSGAVAPRIDTAWKRHPAHLYRAELDDPFVVFTTSGTTSKPKMVLHHQRSIVEHARDVVGHFAYSTDEVVMVAMPLCGTFGLTSFMAAIAADATVVLTDFEVERTAALIEQHRVTCVNGSDDMFHRLVERGADLSSIRLGGYARFNTSLDDIVAAARSAGATLTGLYGMSEVQALFALRDPGGDDVERSRAGGTITSSRAAARVVDDELQLRGPSLFAGYLAEGGDAIDQELTDRHFDDGWFRTADVATMDDDRTFTYITRMGDALRLGGFLVSPAEIEQVLTSIDGVLAAQVVAVDRPTGARPVAFVVAPGGIDETAAIEHCRARLARYKLPIRVWAIDVFPTTPGANGTKIQRGKLRDMAASLLDPAT